MVKMMMIDETALVKGAITLKPPVIFHINQV